MPFGFCFSMGSLGLLVLGVSGVSRAQNPSKALPAVDPYTRGEVEAVRRAGYVSQGPFPWGDDHDTRRIEEALGFAPLWIETAHFRLGTTLAEYTLPGDKLEKAKVRGELERLAEHLDGIQPKARRLDPWLRAHLFAQRLEELYAAFLDGFGLEESDFENTKRGVLTDPYMGQGPFLGQPEKFTVLLFEKPSSLARYTQTFLGLPGRTATRAHLLESGSLFFGTCQEYMRDFETDSALHAFVVFGVSWNLVSGFRYYGHEPPFWWAEGLAHWFSRRIDARWNVYADPRARDDDAWKWRPKIRARVKNEFFPSWDEMLDWKNLEDSGSAGHLILWSRADFLMQRAVEQRRAFLMGINDPFDGTPEEFKQRQLRLFLDAFGASSDDLEADWAHHVLETYPRR